MLSRSPSSALSVEHRQWRSGIVVGRAPTNHLHHRCPSSHQTYSVLRPCSPNPLCHRCRPTRRNPCTGSSGDGQDGNTGVAGARAPPRLRPRPRQSIGIFPISLTSICSNISIAISYSSKSFINFAWLYPKSCPRSPRKSPRLGTISRGPRKSSQLEGSTQIHSQNSHITLTSTRQEEHQK